MEGAVGAYLFGWDYTNRVDRRIRVLPDGSLSLAASMVVDEGVATAGAATTLTDTTKDWEVDIQEGGTVEIIHAGISYQRIITANTATQLTFATLGVAVVAGDVYRIIKALDPMTPQSRGVVHNAAYVAAADILGAAIAPIVQPSLFRCQIACDVAGSFYVRITRGGVPVDVYFNHGVGLVANALYEFDTLVQDGDTVNYRYSIGCNILTFKVLEIPSAI